MNLFLECDFFDDLHHRQSSCNLIKIKQGLVELINRKARLVTACSFHKYIHSVRRLAIHCTIHPIFTVENGQSPATLNPNRFSPKLFWLKSTSLKSALEKYPFDVSLHKVAVQKRYAANDA